MGERGRGQTGDIYSCSGKDETSVMYENFLVVVAVVVWGKRDGT